MEVVLLPVKARTRLVESIATSLDQINEMEKCIAYGIDEGVKFDIAAAGRMDVYERASGKANAALSAAETFRMLPCTFTDFDIANPRPVPFCSTEPRLKGSFEPLALIYEEVGLISTITVMCSAFTSTIPIYR